jgi:hypothetical protein
MSRRIIGVRRGNSVHERIQRPVQDIGELRLVPTTDVVDKAVIIVEDSGGFYRYDYTGTGTDDSSNIIEPTVGPGRWFLMNGIISSPAGKDTERYRYSLPLVYGNQTIVDLDWAHEDFDIVGIQMYQGSVPVSAGVVNLRVRGGGNNLLGLTEIDLKGFAAGSVIDLPITATTPNLGLSEKDIIEVELESGDIDLVGTDLFVVILYETTVVANGGGGGGGLPPTSGDQYAVLMEDPADTPVWQCLRESWICPDFAILSFSLTGGTFIELGDTLLNPSFTATYSLPPTTVTVQDDEGGPIVDVSGTPNAFSYTGSYQKLIYGENVQWTLTADDGVQADTFGRTATWVQRVYYGVATDPGPITEAFIKAGLSGGASPLASSRARTINVTAGAGEHIWYSFRDAYGDATFTVGGFSGGFSKVATISITNGFGIAENYQVWKSDNVALGSTTVVVS